MIADHILATDLDRIRRTYSAALGGRKKEFLVYDGPEDGRHHILACSGGWAIASGIDSWEIATLIADLLNLAARLNGAA
jgi:hypothetical protein